MRVIKSTSVAACLFLTLLVGAGSAAQSLGRPLRVGSKNFTEGHLLGELIAQVIEAQTDLRVERRMGLGGTLVCFGALEKGELDVYAEYTGTAWSVILKEEGEVKDPLETFLHTQARFREAYDLEWLPPFGLNNTYALAMRDERAEELGVTRISDLAALPSETRASLRAGFSAEFLEREDGWPGLRRVYGIELGQVRGMEHALVYGALVSGELDLIDAYSTDGKLKRYALRVLKDDRGFFPPYNAAPVVRGEVLRAHPEVRRALERLSFRLSDRTMTELNYAVEEGGEAFEDLARDFLASIGLSRATTEAERRTPRGQGSFWSYLLQRRNVTGQLIAQHLWMTGVALLLACALAVPLGLLSVSRPLVARLSLGFTSVLQTIPSLALLAFLIPFPAFGLGERTAICALFLYALLPILRNTITGLEGVDRELIGVARGIGLTQRQILLRIKLPLAVPTILAGIRTAAVIAVGVATLAAFIGAGGLGEPIATGLYLNDTRLILSGAIPAALLALAADLGLGGVERLLTPRGMRRPRP